MIVIMPGHLGVRGLFRERVMEINAVDLTEPAPAAPEVILDWKP